MCAFVIASPNIAKYLFYLKHQFWFVSKIYWCSNNDNKHYFI